MTPITPAQQRAGHRSEGRGTGGVVMIGTHKIPSRGVGRPRLRDAPSWLDPPGPRRL